MIYTKQWTGQHNQNNLMDFYLDSALINNNRNAPENKGFVQSVLLQTDSVLWKSNRRPVLSQLYYSKKCSKLNYQLHQHKTIS